MSERGAPDGGPVLVCFAVPDESRLLRAALVKQRVLPVAEGHPFAMVEANLDGRPLTVFHTGIGDLPTARTALVQVLSEARPSFVVSAGYAGGLDPQLDVGDLIAASNFSEPALLEHAALRLDGEGLHCGFLQTEPHAVESAAAKATLNRATGALAVDMETAWIAESCRSAETPLLSLRVISDAASDDFPVPGHILYDARRQRPRYLALPLWLAVHPTRIGRFVRFVRGLGPARERLTRALRAVLAET